MNLAIAALLWFTSLFLTSPQIQLTARSSGGTTPESVAATIVSGQSLTWYGYYADCITYSMSVCSTPSDGTALGTWDDESGNANNLTCTGGGGAIFHTNQINTSYSAVQVAGSQSCTFGTSFTASSSITVYTVVYLSSASTTQNILSCTGGCSGAFDYSFGSSHQRMTATNTSLLVAGSATLSNTTWYQLAGSYDQTNAKMYIGTSSDGTATPSVSITSATNQTMDGVVTYLTGKVALIFIFKGSA